MSDKTVAPGIQPVQPATSPANQKPAPSGSASPKADFDSLDLRDQLKTLFSAWVPRLIILSLVLGIISRIPVYRSSDDLVLVRNQIILPGQKFFAWPWETVVTIQPKPVISELSVPVTDPYGVEVEVWVALTIGIDQERIEAFANRFSGSLISTVEDHRLEIRRALQSALSVHSSSTIYVQASQADFAQSLERSLRSTLERSGLSLQALLVTAVQFKNSEADKLVRDSALRSLSESLRRNRRR